MSPNSNSDQKNWSITLKPWLRRPVVSMNTGWGDFRKSKSFRTSIRLDNAFTHLADPQQAQQIADQFAQLNWVKQLSKWARLVNPHIDKGGWLHGKDYYWGTEQAEYASDVIFKDRSKLRDLYPRLLDHAVVNFSMARLVTGIEDTGFQLIQE